AGVLVDRPAVDRHCRAVLVRGAAEALELRHVPRPVELQLHEGIAGMLADVVSPARVGADEVVGIRVRRALLGELRRRLRVAEREPEPEGRAELEVPGRAAGAGVVRLLAGLRRQRDRVGDVVARARNARLELDRWLVVAHVLARRVDVGVGAKGGPARTQGPVVETELAGGGGRGRARQDGESRYRKGYPHRDGGR